MFDSKYFIDIVEDYQGASVVFVFYDKFSKKFGPLNVAPSINEVVYNACNLLKSVEEKNISLEHISVYVVGLCNPDECDYNLNRPTLFFNGVDYKEAYNTVLNEVHNV